MTWNVQGLLSKFSDSDFINIANSYDVLIFTETWHAKTTNIKLDNFDSFSCPRPKCNRKAKRDSGGVIVYFKKTISSGVVLSKINEKGIIWFKLKASYFSTKNDVYVCACYIPPSDSKVYTSTISPLFEFDFFDEIAGDIRNFAQNGDIMLTGDFNSRVGQKSDLIEDINLDRYVDLPEHDVQTGLLQPRVSLDSACNAFGNKLLNLCKECSILIVNGRMEPGQFTCFNFSRNRPAASVVDYLIVNSNIYSCINRFNVLELNEFSDHCPLEYDLICSFTDADNSLNSSYDRIIWDETCDATHLAGMLNTNKHLFDEIVNNLDNDSVDIDSRINDLSTLIFDISFKLHGKTFNSRKVNNTQVKKSLWFDDTCKHYKKIFYDCKRRYKDDPTDENQLSFLTARSQFCKIKRKTKLKYFNNEKNMLSFLGKTNPRKFWKFINKYKKSSSSVNNEVDKEDFKTHFNDVCNTSHQSTFDFNEFEPRNDDININELDCPITVDEVSQIITSLKRHKSADLFNNVADFFIDSKTFIAPYLCKLFNYIFDKGIYPESWSKGCIVPIFKKGDPSNPANYRGITLVNVIAKIFSLILRNRINTWCESEKIFNPSQFGFRDNHGTVDCIFILHSIIQSVIYNKAKLYCAFIDYEKAFDTVIHEALWIKLVQSGLSCKMLNMIKAIYRKVTSCIKNARDMTYTDFFDITLGVKQGEPLSPLLFIIFINDISESIDFQNLSGQDLHMLSVFLLLFADDIALFTTDPESLQKQLDAIYKYSLKWGLKINVNKTKICIFEKRKSNCNFNWTINEEPVDIVDEFCYLGIKFHCTGNLNKAVKTLNDQALKAYYHLLSVFSRLSIDIKTKLSLFDALVVPIILYGSEVWGVYSACTAEVDKLHYKFCKTLLGVRPQTSNAAVLGELGRFPLALVCKQRSLKYWSKINKDRDSIMFSVYTNQGALNGLNDVTYNATSPLWFNAIKSILDNLGFSNLFHAFNTDIEYMPMLSQRLHDQYIQKWNETLNSQSKMEYYCMFKRDFVFEKYLECVSNKTTRIQLSRFRLCSHSLEIECGRYNRVARNDRKCKLCNQNTVESEYHFMLCCPVYSELRSKYNISITWPTLIKFRNIMSCKNYTMIQNTAKYIHAAMKIREEKLTAIAAS